MYIQTHIHICICIYTHTHTHTHIPVPVCLDHPELVVRAADSVPASEGGKRGREGGRRGRGWGGLGTQNIDNYLYYAEVEQ